MKVTQAQLLAFAKLLAADVEIVDDETQSDYNQDAALQAVDAARMPIIKPQLQKEANDAATARVTGVISDKVKKMVRDLTGIDMGKIKDAATWEEALTLGLGHSKETHSKGTEELQKQIQDMLVTHKDALEAEKKRVTDTEATWKGKWNDREIQSAIAGLLKDVTVRQGADISILAADIKRDLAERYNLTYDETSKALNLFTKENPEMPALNASKTATVNVLDEAKTYLTQRGLIETDMRDRKIDPSTGLPYKPADQTPALNPANPIDANKAAMDKFLTPAAA